MPILLLPLFLLAEAGFFLSFAVHCMTLAKLPIPSAAWALHIGVFVVFFPAVLLSTRLQHNVSRKEITEVLLKGCPAWMRGGLSLLTGYAMGNFAFTMLLISRLHVPSSAVPAYLEFRMFSGHWMIFYATAAAIFYSRVHAPELFGKCACPNGHAISPLANFCPECGSIVAKP